MSYAHRSIVINNRTVDVRDILNQHATPQSAFERETFTFLERWLNHTESINLSTSGSTGTPKAISLTRKQITESATRTIHKLKLASTQTALVCLDTHYIAGKMMLVRALEANMKIVATEPASDPLQKLPDHADFVALVPLQVDEIFKHADSVEKLNRFTSVLIGGAAISNSLHEKIKTLSCAVYATYGMTETVSHVALQKLTGPDVQDYFETLSGITVTTDGRDCLVITVPGFDEPVVTNDLVRMIDSNHFQILGRYDNVINSGGVKLIPESIEKKIESVLQQPFFVAGVPDERLGMKLILLVEGVEQPDLKNALKPVLSAYEIPKQILYINQFERTDTQKINRLKTLEKVLKSNS